MKSSNNPRERKHPYPRPNQKHPNRGGDSRGFGPFRVRAGPNSPRPKGLRRIRGTPTRGGLNHALKRPPEVPLPRRLPHDLRPPHTASSVGGRLSRFCDTWLPQVKDRWVRDILSHGYRIEFSSRPPTRFFRTSPPPERADALLQAVGILKAEGVVVPVPLQQQGHGVYSNLFVVPKKDGSFRPVLDLTLLNKHVRTRRFRMESLRSVIASMSQGDFLASIDIKDAYLHVPIAPEHQRFLRFAIGDEHLQFAALPFGLATAPRVFTKVMATVVAVLHSQGHSVIPYLDDGVSYSSSDSEASAGQTAFTTDRGTISPSRSVTPLEAPHALPGEDGGSNGSSPFRAVPPASSSMGHPTQVGQDADVPRQERLPLSSNQSFPSVVASSHLIIEGEILPTPILGGGHDGREPVRVGSSFSPPQGSGYVDSARVLTSDQCSGDQGSVSCPKSVPAVAGRQADPNSVGQLHSGGLHQPPRWDTQSASLPGSPADSAVGGSHSIHHIRSSHPGRRKLGSRLSQSPGHGRRGMVPSPGRVSGDLLPLGDAERRPNGVTAQQQGPNIHGSISRSQSSGGRCLSSGLVAVSASLCVSSSGTVAQSVTQDQGRLPPRHPRRSRLAEEVVVPGSVASHGRPTVGTARPTRFAVSRAVFPSEFCGPQADCVAIESWILASSGLSQEVIATMRQARKPTSAKIYHRTWKIFLSWCSAQAFSPWPFALPTFLSFLQSGLEKGLSLGSLKGQVSALSVFFSEAPGQTPTGTHVPAGGLSHRPSVQASVRTLGSEQGADGPSETTVRANEGYFARTPFAESGFSGSSHLTSESV
ncbi:uncharacterized protein ACNLHF_026861 [Anomaloglossus baeobatrachus]